MCESEISSETTTSSLETGKAGSFAYVTEAGNSAGFPPLVQSAVEFAAVS
jgi:hypothetical protein